MNRPAKTRPWKETSGETNPRGSSSPTGGPPNIKGRSPQNPCRGGSQIYNELVPLVALMNWWTMLRYKVMVCLLCTCPALRVRASSWATNFLQMVTIGVVEWSRWKTTLLCSSQIVLITSAIHVVRPGQHLCLLTAKLITSLTKGETPRDVKAWTPSWQADSIPACQKSAALEEEMVSWFAGPLANRESRIDPPQNAALISVIEEAPESEACALVALP